MSNNEAVWHHDQSDLDPAFELCIVREMNKPSQLKRLADVRQSVLAAVDHYLRHGDLTVLAKLVLKQEPAERRMAREAGIQALDAAGQDGLLKGKTIQQLAAQLDRLLERLAEMCPSSKPGSPDIKVKVIDSVRKLATNGDWTVLSRQLISQPVLDRADLIELAYRTAAELQEAGQSRFPNLLFRLDKAIRPHCAELSGTAPLKKLSASISPSEADFIYAIGRATWVAVTTGQTAFLRKTLELARHADRKRYTAFVARLLRISKRKSNSLFRNFPSADAALAAMLTTIEEEERKSYLRHRESTENDLRAWKDGRDPERARGLETEFERAALAKVMKDRLTFSSTFSKGGRRPFVQGGAPGLGKRR